MAGAGQVPGATGGLAAAGEKSKKDDKMTVGQSNNESSGQPGGRKTNNRSSQQQQLQQPINAGVWYSLFLLELTFHLSSFNHLFISNFFYLSI